MFIMYIDESGDTISLNQGGKKFLILTGCVINEKSKVVCLGVIEVFQVKATSTNGTICRKPRHGDRLFVPQLVSFDH